MVREVIVQIQLLAPADSEEPLQSLQAPRLQTDDKYKVALQILVQDEYNLVTRLNDFDLVELVKNFVDGSVLSNDVKVLNIRRECLLLKLKVVKRNIAFWEPTGASRCICDTIVDGIRSPLFTPHPQRALAIIDLPFSIVNLWS